MRLVCICVCKHNFQGVYFQVIPGHPQSSVLWTIMTMGSTWVFRTISVKVLVCFCHRDCLKPIPKKRPDWRKTLNSPDCFVALNIATHCNHTERIFLGAIALCGSGSVLSLPAVLRRCFLEMTPWASALYDTGFPLNRKPFHPLYCLAYKWNHLECRSEVCSEVNSQPNPVNRQKMNSYPIPFFIKFRRSDGRTKSVPVVIAD